MYIRKICITIITGALIAAVPLVPAGAQEASQVNTVTVGARRTVDVEPDIGILTLGVSSKGLTAEAASNRLTTKARAVLSALRGAGFTNDELSTVDVNLFRTCLAKCRDRNPDDNFRPKPVIGFRMTAGIRLETNELNRIGEAIDIGIDAGATSLRGVRFDKEDKAEAVNEALRQAMVVAVNKARILAETAGRELGPAIIITEGFTRAPIAYEVQADALQASYGSAAGGSGSSAPNPFPVEPPTLSASARIVVTFELI